MKAQIISFHCVLKDPLGRILSSSFNHDVLAEANGATASPTAPSFSDFHEPIEGLVERLHDLKKGERRQIFLSAEKAYGFYDPALVLQMSRKKLPHGDSLEVGYQVVTQAEDGESRVFRVISTDGLNVTLDGNHPLAGQDLFFDIEATSAREATPEEIAQARVNPPPSAPSLH